MVHALIDFLRTLTTPERLIQLLSTVMTGWLGYALLTGIVFAETGLLVGFFLPGDSLLFTIGVVAGVGHLNIGLFFFLLICASCVGGLAAGLVHRYLTVPIHASSSVSTCSALRSSMPNMAARPSSTRSLFRSSV